MQPRSAIRVPDGFMAIDLRPDGTALPQECIRLAIACTPANWRDVYGRAVYVDELGHEFALERRHRGLYPCLYLVHPVETEEDDEGELFLHYREEEPDYA